MQQINIVIIQALLILCIAIYSPLRLKVAAILFFVSLQWFVLDNQRHRLNVAEISHFMNERRWLEPAHDHFVIYYLRHDSIGKVRHRA